MKIYFLILSFIVALASFPYRAAAEDQDFEAPGDLTWEELLAKAKKKSSTNLDKETLAPPRKLNRDRDSSGPEENQTKPQISVSESYFKPETDDVEAQWQKILKQLGYAQNNTHGWIQTRYPDGALQSKRLFNNGLIEKLYWYSMEGVLLFEGDFSAGQLYHRKRYRFDTGELESEWWEKDE
jgi:antitoxin component YwqK of YwqJK toxin-antitoxin module